MVIWPNQTLFWSDADSKMRKAFPILMMNQGCFTYCSKLFRSNVHFSKKKFGQMTIFRSYVIWLVFKVRFSVDRLFSKYFRLNDLLINLVYCQMTFFPFFGKNKTLDQTAFGETAIRSNVFRSNDIRSNSVRSNGVSVKWPFGQKFSVKWFFGKVIQKTMTNEHEFEAWKYRY
jgi:hypothetical protein